MTTTDYLLAAIAFTLVGIVWAFFIRWWWIAESAAASRRATRTRFCCRPSVGERCTTV